LIARAGAKAGKSGRAGRDLPISTRTGCIGINI
jgi:hypothetical protein